MISPDSPSLNSLRDSVIAELRSLATRFADHYPDAESAELKGILTRAESVMNTQLARLDRLAAVDLEEILPDPGEREERLEALLGVEHVPRIVISYMSLLEKEGDRSLEPLRPGVREAVQHLELLLQRWVLRQGGWDDLVEETY